MRANVFQRDRAIKTEIVKEELIAEDGKRILIRIDRVVIKTKLYEK